MFSVPQEIPPPPPPAERFMEPEVSILSSQKPTIGLHPELKKYFSLTA
jgi:hypothetical protein